MIAMRIVLKYRETIETQIVLEKMQDKIRKYSRNTNMNIPWLRGGCVSHVAIASNEENDPGAKDGRDVLKPKELDIKLAKQKIMLQINGSMNMRK